MMRCFMFRNLIPSLLTLLFLLGTGISSRAEDLVWVSGRVCASDGKSPLSGAIVAVYDEKNKVVDYSRTDNEGNYSLAVPRNLLHLNGRGGGGLLRQVAEGMGRVIAFPLKTGLKIAGSAVNTGDPITKAGVGAATGLAQTLVNGMSRTGGKKVVLERNLPGVVLLKVAMPGHNDVISPARIYWMEEQIYKKGGKQQKALAAWVDPACLTRVGDTNPSVFQSSLLTFSEARFEPSIVEPGQTVSLIVRIPAPTDPRTPFLVVARSHKTGKTYPLLPVGGDLYRAEITIDKRFPKNDQIFTVLAYAEQDDHPGYNKKAEDALKGAGLFDPEKPYLYNPLLAVSRNRAEVTLTVVQPSKRR